MLKGKCGDIDVCYDVRGEGFPLVMIMGLGGNMDWWDPRLIRGTSKRYRTVMFDNRGAGRSDAPDIDYSIRMFADDTAKLMDNLTMQKAHVLGISMGGMIAQEFVLAYPERVEKLVLCSTNCGASQSVPPAPRVLDSLSGWASETLDDMIKNIVSILFTNDFIKGNPVYMKLVTEQILKVPIAPDAFMRQVKAIMAWDSYARLPDIRVPTLVMHGMKDVLIPPENARILADKIPGAKLAYFEKSAHALFSQETDTVVNTLLEFLA